MQIGNKSRQETVNCSASLVRYQLNWEQTLLRKVLKVKMLKRINNLSDTAYYVGLFLMGITIGILILLDAVKPVPAIATFVGIMLTGMAVFFIWLKIIKATMSETENFY